MKTKNMLLVILTIVILLAFSSGAAAQPNITGEAAILVDAETGKVLWGQNERNQMAPASITKLVTVLVAIEKGNLQDEVTVSEKAADTIGSRVWLQVGEVKTLEDLLYAAMLNSGNDAAIAIAEHIGGTVDDFVYMMNQRVREIGAHQTRFMNPTGLIDEGHHSTAYDIALIMREALKNPKLKEIMGTDVRDWYGQEWQSRLMNLNQLLGQYEGSLGGKTGYTSEAGRCLVNVAERDRMRLISVVLRSSGQNIWSDTTRILDYGFNNYHMLKFVDQGEEILQIDRSGRVIPVIAGNIGEYLVSRNAEILPTSQIKIDNFSLPLREGDVIGTMEFILDGEVIESVELVSGINARRSITLVGVYTVVTLIFFGLVALVLFLKAINMLMRRRNDININKARKPRYGGSRMY